MNTDFLVRSQDQIIANSYRLGKVLHHSDEGALYETEFGDNAVPAVIKIRPGGTADAARLVSQWQDAVDLQHPNLLSVYKAGESVIDGVPVVYVVMERAEESLAGVLAERALSEAETRELLTPTVSVLTYLHKSGYAHSSLKDSNILAVGDRLKLSGDNVKRAGDDGLPAAVPAEDMWALGAVIVQALTRVDPRRDGGFRSDLLRNVPDPFADIARHCLVPDPARRWTAEQVAARLEGRLILPVSPVAPVRNNLRSQRERAESPAGWSRTWVYGGLAVLALITFLVVFGRNKSPAPETVTSRSQAVQQPESSAPPPAREPAAPVPDANNPGRSAEASPSAIAPVPIKPSPYGGQSRRASGWYVIVASYGFRDPAEKRQQDLARRWPKFKVSVYEQHADKVYYLVSVGQNLSEDEAEAVRKRAVAAGLPRDTYIKRF